MNTTDLLGLFRSEVDDLEENYLWSDELVYGFIDDAQKQFCRDTNGILDARSFRLNIVAGTEWYALSPKILKLRGATNTATGRPVPLIAYEKMAEGNMYFDGATGFTKALILGLEENKVRVWPVPFTRTVPVARASNADYIAGDIIVVAGKAPRYFTCVSPGTTAASIGTLYAGAYTGPITDGTARFTDGTAALTSTVELQTFRLPATVEAGGSLEIPEQHHPHLLHWVKHRAYAVQDAETFNPNASAKFLAYHQAYCAKALNEQNRARRPVSNVSYGGI